MSTTPATPSCSCLPAPSSRPPCSWTFLSWTSSWWPCRADFALDIFTVCSSRLASPRTRPSRSRSRTRSLALSRGPGWAFTRQHGWTCIPVAFLLLPARLLKVHLSLNAPGSPVVWAAHRCSSARSCVRWLVAHAERPPLFLRQHDLCDSAIIVICAVKKRRDDDDTGDGNGRAHSSPQRLERGVTHLVQGIGCGWVLETDGLRK